MVDRQMNRQMDRQMDRQINEICLVHEVYMHMYIQQENIVC